MKLDAGRIDAFLKNPGTPLVLIFGPDSGLVAERGLALARAIPGTLEDPFRFTELHNPDPATLLAEATAASLTGGRRAGVFQERIDASGVKLHAPGWL